MLPDAEFKGLSRGLMMVSSVAVENDSEYVELRGFKLSSSWARQRTVLDRRGIEELNFSSSIVPTSSSCTAERRAPSCREYDAESLSDRVCRICLNVFGSGSGRPSKSDVGLLTTGEGRVSNSRRRNWEYCEQR